MTLKSYYAMPEAARTGLWCVVETMTGKIIFSGRDEQDARALAADLNGEGQ